MKRVVHIHKDQLSTFMEDPWWVIPDSMAESFNRELKRELTPDHILFGKDALAVARREDNADVVYLIKELNKFAVVHLTYTSFNSSNYPITRLFTLSELDEYCKEVSKLY